MNVRLTAALLITLPFTSALAQESDPDWPCAQQLVPKIVAAQLWSGPLPDENVAMTAPPDLSELGRNAMDSKVSEQDAVKSLKTYFAKVKSPQKRLEQIPTAFIVALTEANSRRDRQINGIKSFTRGQFALSKQLAADVNELDKLTQGQPAKEGTPEKAIEEKVQFERRVFEDREHQVKYLCEAPADGEARLGLVARTLEALLPR